jgi:hypothetical protein
MISWLMIDRKADRVEFCLCKKLHKQLRKPADFVVQKVAQQDQSDQHRIYTPAEDSEAFDRKKARDEAGKAATKK